MTEIKMSVDIDDLRSIYFRDNQHKLFFGQSTKKQSTFLIIGVILVPPLAFYSWYIQELGLLLFAIIFLFAVVYEFWKAARNVIQWRKSVEEFLTKAENTKDLRLSYNETSFVHIHDNDTLKQDWTIIEKAVINERLIWLFSDTNVLLPRSSMSELEFDHLSKLITSKVKNVQKTLNF